MKSILFVSALGLSAAFSPLSAASKKNVPETILADPRVHLTFGAEQEIMPGGLQPSLVITKTGAMIAQGQQPKKPLPAKRMTFPSALGMVISRDRGATWTLLPLKPGENGLNMEGGAIQLRDGSLLALDTYVTPGPTPGTGAGQLYTSNDDWKTLVGPIDITFTLPGVKFTGSSDDGGHPHEAVRLHRRILELANGDLLTTLYGWFDGDTEPSGYMPTMKKTRVVLLRSTNRGRHWDLVSTVAVGAKVGTEGFDEAVLARIGQGPHAGRLLCKMRTGREQREAFSDDGGKTWSKSTVCIYAGRDVYDTAKWAEMFRGVKDKKGQLIENNPNEMIGAVVDPDLVELSSGVLVTTFGMRIPPRACWPRAQFPWNGNYVAISLDHGATWSHVVQLTSGVLTTHYTAVEATPNPNEVYIAYDLGDWGSGQGRSLHGRFMQIKVDAK
ncbi:MAG: sialidase family protein [Opitutaceae bacterium]